MNLKKKSTTERLDVAFEIKQFEEEDDFFMFEGFASTFGNMDLVDDIMLTGSFAESIEKELPVLLWQHDSREPIGITVKAQETDKGLFIRGHMPKDDDFVRGRVVPQMKIGSITKMSIGFHVIESELDLEDPRIRRIAKVDLKEISLVTFPANPLAAVTGIKSIGVEALKSITSKKEYEICLRDAGFSKSAANMAVSKKFNESLQSESADDDVELTRALKAISSDLEERKALDAISKISKKVETHVRNASGNQSTG